VAPKASRLSRLQNQEGGNRVPGWQTHVGSGVKSERRKGQKKIYLKRGRVVRIRGLVLVTPPQPDPQSNEWACFTGAQVKGY